MRYFIAQAQIDWSDDRWENKGGIGLSPKRRKGFIGLWDRNTYKFYWFKIIKKAVDRYGYIVERNGRVPIYWRESIRAE